MTNGWTDERREKQAERIRRQKPWEKSTGPRSSKGKAVSSKNALKHGLYGAESEVIKALLRMNADFLALYAQLNGERSDGYLALWCFFLFHAFHRGVTVGEGAFSFCGAFA